MLRVAPHWTAPLICISDALRQLTGRGLLKKCQPYSANTSKRLAQMYYNSAVARLSCISSLVSSTTWQHCRKRLRRTLLIQLPSSRWTAPTLSIALRASNFQQYYSRDAKNACAPPLLHLHRQILTLNLTDGTFCGNSLRLLWPSQILSQRHRH